MAVFIYVIKDPRTDLVRYVGKTKNPAYRFRKHLTAKIKSYSSRWIQACIREGAKPTFEIIDEVAEHNWQEAEKGYIKLFKSLGAKLLNQLPGGEGGPSMLGRTLTLEQCNKISASKIGKPNKGAGQHMKASHGYTVNQYDLLGNYIATHLSIKDAAKAIGRNYRRIQIMISGGKKTVNHVGGFVFQRVINE